MAFQKVPKTTSLTPLKCRYKEHREMYIDFVASHKQNIVNLVSRIKEYDNKFLFGCHVTSQFLLFNGLNE